LPTVTHFGWSPLITAALGANARIIASFITRSPPSPHLPSRRISNPTPLSGPLTPHIRRGDFIERSLHLANWTSSYTAYNEFPGRSDRLPSPREYSKHIFMDGYQVRGCLLVMVLPDSILRQVSLALLRASMPAVLSFLVSTGLFKLRIQSPVANFLLGSQVARAHSSRPLGGGASCSLCSNASARSPLPLVAGVSTSRPASPCGGVSRPASP
jgi:hypothetical protein